MKKAPLTVMMAILTAICILTAGISLSGTAAVAEEKPLIVATNFPCYDFARQIVGVHADVLLLIRPGTEVHSYEPTPSDIVSIGKTALFVYIGGESDSWVDGILASFGGSVPSIRMMDAVEGLEVDHEHAVEGIHHDELKLDEHIWTSPKRAAAMVDMLAETLCEAMPEYEAAFRTNADAYIAEINRIDDELEEIVAGAARTKLVFGDRFPFLYLAHDYHLSYSAAFTSCAEDTEPSAQTMVELIREVAMERIPVIYTIEMSTGTIARTIAEETGVEILTLHSVQNVTQSEFDAGETYVSLMQKNLEAIRKGLY